MHGGIGQAPKFPQMPLFQLLWRAWKRTKNQDFKSAVTLTLTRMCQGGIYDHLGGGFARYSVDASWLVPHFEKMLYDNAQLIELLTLVWQETRDQLYSRQRVARDRRLAGARDAGGAERRGRPRVRRTLDADSEGEEGKFYVWTEAEIDALLGAEAGVLQAAYDVTPTATGKATPS